MSRVLVTGMSGTGKSSALAELGRRGYRIVDTDDPGWSEWVESPEEVFGGEWLWVEDRMTHLLRSDDEGTLFVAGCVRNQDKYYEQFEVVVLLSAPADILLDRVAHRTTNSYGKTPAERHMILHHITTVEPLLRADCAHELDANRPLAEVVADLIAIGSRPELRGRCVGRSRQGAAAGRQARRCLDAPRMAIGPYRQKGQLSRLRGRERVHREQV